MRKLILISALAISATAFGRPSGYRLDPKANGSINSATHSDTLGSITGYWSGTQTWTTTSNSQVTHEEGGMNKPCPWTLTYANLYNNTWTYSYSFTGVVNSNVTVVFKVDYIRQIGNERWIETATDVETRRQYLSKSYEDTYYIE